MEREVLFRKSTWYCIIINQTVLSEERKELNLYLNLKFAIEAKIKADSKKQLVEEHLKKKTLEFHFSYEAPSCIYRELELGLYLTLALLP